MNENKAPQFIEVKLEGIEQGIFLEKANQSFHVLQRKLIEFIDEHKVDGKAVLTLKITIESDIKGSSYQVITEIDEKVPKTPATVTTALQGTSAEDGKPSLFALNSGTNTGSNPRQTVLCKENGAPLDETQK